MGLPKGKTNNPNGKPKGARSQKTIQWEELGEAIVSTHTERFNKILETSDDEKFTRLYTNILNYFKPQLQRTELKGDLKVEQEQVFKFGDSEFKF